MTITSLYADGGVIGANPSPLGGTWAWCLVTDQGEHAQSASGVLLPRAGELITNNVTELAAVVFGLEATPLYWQGTVYSDSWVTLQRVFCAGKLNNVPGWLMDRLHAVQRSGKLRTVAYQLLDGHPTKAQLEAGTGKRGHPVSIHNVWCDQQCTAQARAHKVRLAQQEAA